LYEGCGYPKGCEDLEERDWYIQAVRRFGWTKTELLEQIHAKAYLEALDFADAVCYTEGNAKAKDAPCHASVQGTQCDGTRSAGSGVWLSKWI